MVYASIIIQHDATIYILFTVTAARRERDANDLLQ